MDKTIKVTFIPGLKNIVLDEIKKVPDLEVKYQGDDYLYLNFITDFKEVLTLRSILNAYIVKQENNLNPYYLSNHKSILGELIDIVIKQPFKYKSFKLSCAGSDSKEVKDIKKYISSTYKLSESEEADLEVFIGKSNNTWEVGVRITTRPLTLRDYKIKNIKGGLNPTIAYAMNTFCDLNSIKSYLNIFSGSGTLLIEAGLINKDLNLVGFDHNGKNNALAVENIKKAGLIKVIKLKTADIFDAPELGTFDFIASDLPFGMQISKGEDLEKLYKAFITYSEEVLEKSGKLVIYTTEHELLVEIIGKSRFLVTETLELKVPTVTGGYIYPKVFVCKLKV
ncbi:MAG TPA: methyltransferase [Candidatus Paceibacterota bacterium]|nr:methyltransferase [Candidatus Paceibacterota bacterium]